MEPLFACVTAITGIILIVALIVALVIREENRQSKLTEDQKRHEDGLRDDLFFW